MMAAFTHCVCMKIDVLVVSFEAEVKEIHRLLNPKPDAVNIYVDEWGTKRLTSWAIRRFRTGQDSFRD